MSLPLAASELMSALDDCAASDSALVLNLERAAQAVQPDLRLPESLAANGREQRRATAMWNMEIVRWHKTRCVQDAIFRFLPADEKLRTISRRVEWADVLHQMAIYRGFKGSERERLKCRPESGRACSMNELMRDFERQSILIALDDFIDDVDRADQENSTLRGICVVRLSLIDQRILDFESSVRTSHTRR